MRYQTRLLAPDPDTIWGDTAVQGIVGQPVAFSIGPLHTDRVPTAVVTKAWVDDEGWLCAEIDVDYGGVIVEGEPVVYDLASPQSSVSGPVWDPLEP